MKKNKFTEFFKAKGYYVLLFVGVIAIAAVALIGSNLSSKNDENNNSVDLNEPDNNIAAGEDQNQVAENNNEVSNEVANNEQGGNKTGDTATNENAGQSTADNTAGSQDPIELEDYAQGGDTTDVAQAADTTEETAEEPEEPAAVETAGKTVQADNNPVLDDLSFNADDGLRWPIKGNVIMNYSMDHTIYHATLMLYKCNPAIIIDAEVGDEVKAAAKGVVTSIEEDNDETGCTVTTSIGDGYSLVYGQLDGEALDLEVGDTVDAGDAIGLIAEPTEYYTVEGSNLYFKVLENDQTVNPMSLLK